MTTRKFRIFAAMVLSIVFATTVTAQSTQFTYQGRLKDGPNIANGNYDFEFALFDASSSGTQLGQTISLNSVAVTEGAFSVQLDFGSQFTGAGRFLEIRVRSSGGGAFNALTPRQSISSTPYSVKSLSAISADNAVNTTNATNATNLTGSFAGDVTGTQGTTTVARIQGREVSSATPTAGQVLKFNGTTNQWTPDTDNTASGSGGGTITGVAAGTGLTGGGSTGNVALAVANGGIGTPQLADNGVTDAKINTVSGSKVTGTVANATNAVNATNAATATNAQIAANASLLNNLNSTDFIRNSTNSQVNSNFNVSGTGTASILNASTQYNIGGNRILSNPGTANLFVGIEAGVAPNAVGQRNSFFGWSAGKTSFGGYDNAFFGQSAGMANVDGDLNSFFGSFAGLKSEASVNSFFGTDSGRETTTGRSNSFFGAFAGVSNVTGNSNTAVGNSADVATGNLSYATAIGADAVVSNSNTIALGRGGGEDTVMIPGAAHVAGSIGIGTPTPTQRLHVAGNGQFDGRVFISGNSMRESPAGNDSLTVTGSGYFNGGLTVNGTLSGSGTGLTNLNATNISSGTLNNARLGIVPIAHGGTGSATQNFVDLTTAQTIGGIKNFTGTVAANTNIGIGTTTPAKRLHIVGALDQEIAIESSDLGGRRWTLQSSSGASNGRFEIVDRTPGEVANRMTILSNGNVGIGTTTPNTRLDVRGGMRLGNSGEWDAAAGQERLRILRGDVSGGNTDSGIGWTMARTNGQAVGDFTITFTTPFPFNPVVTATAVDATTRQTAVIAAVTETSVRIRTFNNAGSLVDTQFFLIAMGTW